MFSADILDEANRIRRRSFGTDVRCDLLRSWVWVHKQYAMDEHEALDVFLVLGPEETP